MFHWNRNPTTRSAIVVECIFFLSARNNDRKNRDNSIVKHSLVVSKNDKEIYSSDKIISDEEHSMNA